MQSLRARASNHAGFGLEQFGQPQLHRHQFFGQVLGPIGRDFFADLEHGLRQELQQSLVLPSRAQRQGLGV